MSAYLARRSSSGAHFLNTFIIFTLDYRDFCEHFFGRFLHHRPSRPTDKPDGGATIRRTMEALKEHFGGMQMLSDNWRFPGMKTNKSDLSAACSSDSVSCSPTPSCDSSVNTCTKHF
jgi:hypothetical protein